MIVIARRPGQLGNQLFAFAHFIAWSIDHKIEISNPAFFENADLFETTRNDLYCRYPERRSLLPRPPFLRLLLYRLTLGAAAVIARVGFLNRWVRVLRIDWHEIYALRDAKFQHLTESTRVVLAQGWLFEDDEGLEKHADEIRRFFRPLETHRRNTDRLLEECRNDVDVLVGIHIRRGDYEGFLGGKYLYNDEEYRNIMKDALQLFPDRRVRFLLCSNDELDQASWTEGFDCSFGTGVPIEDMLALSGCDYVLGPPSTFTIWASYYGRVPLFMITDAQAPKSVDEFEIHMSQMSFPEIVRLKEQYKTGHVEPRSPWLG